MLAKNIIKIVAAGMLLVSCETISEDECVAGNWADIGYRDGVNGTDRARITKYVEKCGEFGQGVDRNTYLSNYETGLSHYCTYDKGFALGEAGSSYNAVCEGSQAADFRTGFDNGHADYELRQTYDRFEQDIVSLEDEVSDVNSRLNAEGLDDKERARLRKKVKRLREELKDLRWDFRQFRRKYDFD